MSERGLKYLLLFHTGLISSLIIITPYAVANLRKIDLNQGINILYSIPRVVRNIYTGRSIFSLFWCKLHRSFLPISLSRTDAGPLPHLHRVRQETTDSPGIRCIAGYGGIANPYQSNGLSPPGRGR